MSRAPSKKSGGYQNNSTQSVIDITNNPVLIMQFVLMFTVCSIAHYYREMRGILFLEAWRAFGRAALLAAAWTKPAEFAEGARDPP